eukprot:1767169-Pyramimonas_sp.AAC.1
MQKSVCDREGERRLLAGAADCLGPLHHGRRADGAQPALARISGRVPLEPATSLGSPGGHNFVPSDLLASGWPQTARGEIVSPTDPACAGTL